MYEPEEAALVRAKYDAIGTAMIDGGARSVPANGAFTRVEVAVLLGEIARSRLSREALPFEFDADQIVAPGCKLSLAYARAMRPCRRCGGAVTTPIGLHPGAEFCHPGCLPKKDS